MTQLKLANQLYVCDKTVSKWETGKSVPNLNMMKEISKVFKMSFFEFVSDLNIKYTNQCGNLLKTRFCVCPVCGNILYSQCESYISCYGIQLSPLEAQKDTMGSIEKIENEYYVSIEHEMTKKHYISFIAALSKNTVQLVKLYPEQKAEAYFKREGVGKIYYCSNLAGLYEMEL